MEKIDTFKNRLKSALNITNTKQVDLCKKINVDKSAITHYLKGDSEPRQDKLEDIAEVLNVNPVWLMGYDVPFYNLSQEKISVEEAKEEIEKLINMSDMTEQQKAMVMTPLNYISEEKKEEDKK